MLERKKILKPSSLELLKFIHRNLRISIGGREVTTSRGVPQGLATSPALFDIYTESILEKLSNGSVFGLMFADDTMSAAEDRREVKRAIVII